MKKRWIIPLLAVLLLLVAMLGAAGAENLFRDRDADHVIIYLPASKSDSGVTKCLEQVSIVLRNHFPQAKLRSAEDDERAEKDIFARSKAKEGVLWAGLIEAQLDRVTTGTNTVLWLLSPANASYADPEDEARLGTQWERLTACDTLRINLILAGDGEPTTPLLALAQSSPEKVRIFRIHEDFGQRDTEDPDLHTGDWLIANLYGDPVDLPVDNTDEGLRFTLPEEGAALVLAGCNGTQPQIAIDGVEPETTLHELGNKKNSLRYTACYLGSHAKGEYSLSLEDQKDTTLKVYAYPHLPPDTKLEVPGEENGKWIVKDRDFVLSLQTDQSFAPYADRCTYQLSHSYEGENGWVQTAARKLSPAEPKYAIAKDQLENYCTNNVFQLKTEMVAEDGNRIFVTQTEKQLWIGWELKVVGEPNREITSYYYPGQSEADNGISIRFDELFTGVSPHTVYKIGLSEDETYPIVGEFSLTDDEMVWVCATEGGCEIRFDPSFDGRKDLYVQAWNGNDHLSCHFGIHRKNILDQIVFEPNPDQELLLKFNQPVSGRVILPKEVVEGRPQNAREPDIALEMTVGQEDAQTRQIAFEKQQDGSYQAQWSYQLPLKPSRSLISPTLPLKLSVVSPAAEGSRSLGVERNYVLVNQTATYLFYAAIGLGALIVLLVLILIIVKVCKPSFADTRVYCLASGLGSEAEASSLIGNSEPLALSFLGKNPVSLDALLLMSHQPPVSEELRAVLADILLKPAKDHGVMVCYGSRAMEKLGKGKHESKKLIRPGEKLHLEMDRLHIYLYNEMR